MSSARDERALTTAAQSGDESAFEALIKPYRRELQVHCYRMLGSLEDAEDLLQETLLRAWRRRETFTFEERWSFRAWLYRIATNACLDALRAKPRRVLPWQVEPAADPDAQPRPPADLPWLQPYPDNLLEGIARRADEPDAVVVSRETIELSFLIAVQVLPPRQRAALILRDVLDWSAKDTAALMDASVASANSALQRARATLRNHLPESRSEWKAKEPTSDEREILARYMEAHERGDARAVALLLAEDAQASMPPSPTWHQGREAIASAMARAFDPSATVYLGPMRVLPTSANTLPAAATYVRPPGESLFRPLSLDVLRVEHGQIAEITAFPAEVFFPRFGLPEALR